MYSEIVSVISTYLSSLNSNNKKGPAKFSAQKNGNNVKYWNLSCSAEVEKSDDTLSW